MIFIITNIANFAGRRIGRRMYNNFLSSRLLWMEKRSYLYEGLCMRMFGIENVLAYIQDLASWTETRPASQHMQL